MTDGRWSEGICEDGAAILFDGQPVPIARVIEELNTHPAQQDAELVEDFIKRNLVCRDPAHNRTQTLKTLGRCTCANLLPVEAVRQFIAVLTAKPDGVGVLKVKFTFSGDSIKLFDARGNEVGNYKFEDWGEPPEPKNSPIKFEDAWRIMEARGYQYGQDAKQNAKVGFNLAFEIMAMKDD